MGNRISTKAHRVSDASDIPLRRQSSATTFEQENLSFKLIIIIKLKLVDDFKIRVVLTKKIRLLKLEIKIVVNSINYILLKKAQYLT